MTSNLADDLFFSAPSRRFKLRLIKRFIETAPDDRILEIGCGYGTIIHSFSQSIKNAVGIDYSKDLIDIAKTSYKGTVFKVADAEKIDFPDNSFTKIFLFDVLEHVEDDKKVLKNCSELLVPGGKLYILTQRSDSYWRTIENALYGSDKCGHYHDGFSVEYFRNVDAFSISRVKHIYPLFTPIFTKLNNCVGFLMYKTLKTETMISKRKKMHEGKLKNELLKLVTRMEFHFCLLDLLLPVKGDSFVIELENKKK